MKCTVLEVASWYKFRINREFSKVLSFMLERYVGIFLGNVCA